MAFDGLKKIFNRLGNLTFDSTQKMGEGVQRTEDRVKKIRPRRPDVRYPIRKKKTDSKLKTSGKTVSKKGDDRDEIAVLRDLVGQKYEQRGIVESETLEKQQALRKASLEELLREEEKKGLDPRIIIIMGIVSFAVVFVALLALGFGFEIGLVFGILILFMSMFIVYLPKIQSGGRSTAASRELPFALRQMATELKAGIGLHDSMRSVAISGYGPLSEEFARTLEEIKYGETTEKALMDMSERIASDGLKRAVYQITRTLSSGGDLAKALTVIADDTAYEMRMKLKDYAQKLNSFTMIYMFVAILGPVIFMIMMIAASTVMGPIVPDMLLIILYLFLFPAIVAFMAFMIKRLEPKL
jgi:flagellar protein FlaJ